MSEPVITEATCTFDFKNQYGICRMPRKNHALWESEHQGQPFCHPFQCDLTEATDDVVHELRGRDQTFSFRLGGESIQRKTLECRAADKIEEQQREIERLYQYIGNDHNCQVCADGKGCVMHAL